MGVLPDHILKSMGETLIDPFNPTHVQPASIDLHLDRFFYEALTSVWPPASADSSVDCDALFGDKIEVPEGKTLILAPNAFVIASTFERVTIPRHLVARFEGKSSLGRLGLLTHITAGFIDPGFSGHITLEIKNVMPGNWKITPGMKIGQICFEELIGVSSKPYGNSEIGSHYQNAERGPTLSRSHLNFKKVNVY